MLKVPPPTRVPLGALQVGSQKVELILSPEWARYFEALNSQVLANSENLARRDAYAASIGETQDVSDPLPGPPGRPGLQGDPGLPLFLLQDDVGESPIVPGPAGHSGRQGEPGIALFLLHEDPSEQSPMVPPCVDGVYVPLNSKDAPNGVPGLTQLKLNLRNAAGTITSWFTTAATAARTWTMPNKDGTVAIVEDFAAPPAIGNTTAAAGAFTALTASTLNGVALSGNPGAALNVQGGGTLRSAAFKEVSDFAPSGGSSADWQSGKFGCNGKAPQAAAASGGTLAGVIAALVANGILSS